MNATAEKTNVIHVFAHKRGRIRGETSLRCLQMADGRYAISALLAGDYPNQWFYPTIEKAREGWKAGKVWLAKAGYNTANRIR